MNTQATVVCKIDLKKQSGLLQFVIAWAEPIFVKEKYRRHGVATALRVKAEEITTSCGDDTVYKYVHPNNHHMIEFLRKRVVIRF